LKTSFRTRPIFCHHCPFPTLVAVEDKDKLFSPVSNRRLYIITTMIADRSMISNRPKSKRRETRSATVWLLRLLFADDDMITRQLVFFSLFSFLFFSFSMIK
jgi:hypothetical protein